MKLLIKRLINRFKKPIPVTNAVLPPKIVKPVIWQNARIESLPVDKGCLDTRNPD